eukprot:256348_1
MTELLDALIKTFEIIYDADVIQELLNEGLTVEEAKNVIRLSHIQDMKVEPQYQCICGSNLIKINNALDIYNGKGCSCDQCGNQFKMNDIAWHCDQNNMHLGLDICSNCIDTFDPQNFQPRVSPSQIPFFVSKLMERATIDKETINKQNLLDLTHHIGKADIVHIDERKSTLAAGSLISKKIIDPKFYVLSEYEKNIIIVLYFDEKIDIESITFYSLHDTIDYIENSDNLTKPQSICVYQIEDIPVNEFGKSNPSWKTENPHSSVIKMTNRLFDVSRMCITINSFDNKLTYLNGIELEATKSQLEKDYNVCMNIVKNVCTDHTDL